RPSSPCCPCGKRRTFSSRTRACRGSRSILCPCTKTSSSGKSPGSRRRSKPLMKLTTYFFMTLALATAALLEQRNFAQEATSTSWELTPYRVEICVIVEPSARLSPALEGELTQQLVALAEAANGGPWQVTAGKPVAKGRSGLLKQLALLDESPE